MASEGASEASHHKICCICSRNTAQLEQCKALTRKYEALEDAHSQKLSRMTRYNPKDWPASLCSNNIAKHITTDGDNRYANHHYHP